MVYLPAFYHTNQPNVGKYTIHGSYGYYIIYIYIFTYKYYVQLRLGEKSGERFGTMCFLVPDSAIHLELNGCVFFQLDDTRRNFQIFIYKMIGCKNHQRSIFLSGCLGFQVD